MKATGGKGANLVVNNVGGSMFAETIRALAYEGRHATVGYVDGVLKSEIDIEALHTKRLTLFGVSNRLRNAEQRPSPCEASPPIFFPSSQRGRSGPCRPRFSPSPNFPREGLHGIERAPREDRGPHVKTGDRPRFFICGGPPQCSSGKPWSVPGLFTARPGSLPP